MPRPPRPRPGLQPRRSIARYARPVSSRLSRATLRARRDRTCVQYVTRATSTVGLSHELRRISTTTALPTVTVGDTRSEISRPFDGSSFTGCQFQRLASPGLRGVSRARHLSAPPLVSLSARAGKHASPDCWTTVQETFWSRMASGRWRPLAVDPRPSKPLAMEIGSVRRLRAASASRPLDPPRGRRTDADLLPSSSGASRTSVDAPRPISPVIPSVDPIGTALILAGFRVRAAVDHWPCNQEHERAREHLEGSPRGVAQTTSSDTSGSSGCGAELPRSSSAARGPNSAKPLAHFEKCRGGCCFDGLVDLADVHLAIEQ